MAALLVGLDTALAAACPASPREQALTADVGFSMEEVDDAGDDEGDATRPSHTAVHRLSRSDSIVWAEQQLGSQRDLVREGPGRATSSRVLPCARAGGASTSYGLTLVPPL